MTGHPSWLERPAPMLAQPKIPLYAKVRCLDYRNAEGMVTEIRVRSGRIDYHCEIHVPESLPQQMHHAWFTESQLVVLED